VTILLSTHPDPAVESADIITLTLTIARAASQISATVPLVLVMRTGIDGGSATVSDASYAIQNNSSMRVQLTEAAEQTAPGSPLTRLTNADLAAARDQYAIAFKEDYTVSPRDIEVGTRYNPLERMSVSPLSFVTRQWDGTNEYGVKFSTITYTLNIPSADAQTQAP
jgi:hypothetical protein